MPDTIGPASEFGGKTNKLGVQPLVRPDGKPGHSPTVGERLSLYYRTGDEQGQLTADSSFMEGLLRFEEQKKALADAGLLDKGVDL